MNNEYMPSKILSILIILSSFFFPSVFAQMVIASHATETGNQ